METKRIKRDGLCRGRGCHEDKKKNCNRYCDNKEIRCFFDFFETERGICRDYIPKKIRVPRPIDIERLEGRTDVETSENLCRVGFTDDRGMRITPERVRLYKRRSAES